MNKECIFLPCFFLDTSLIGQKIILTVATQATRKKNTNHKDNITPPPQGLSRSYTICPRPYSITDKVKTRTIQPDSWFKLLSTSYSYDSIPISKRAYSCPVGVRWTFCLLPLTLFKTVRMKEIITRTSKEFTLHSFSDGHWISGSCSDLLIIRSIRFMDH